MSDTAIKPRFATAKKFIAEWNSLGERGRAQDQTMRQIILRAQVYYDPDLWNDLVEKEKMAVLVAARELGFLASDETATTHPATGSTATVVTTFETFAVSAKPRSRMGHGGGKRGRWGRGR